MARAWELKPDDVVFSHLPFFHVGGFSSFLLPAMAAGATAAVGASFSARRYTDDLMAVGATVITIAGAHIRMVLSNETRTELDQRTVRLIAYGQAVTPALEERFALLVGGIIRAQSGTTEGVGNTYIEPLHEEHRWPSLGKAAEGYEVRIIDDDGVDVPIGSDGELLVRGVPGVTLMLEYWRNASATSKAIQDGWLHTGDIGRSDQDGYLYFVDRKKDMIKRSGESVSAAEVERVLQEFPGVVEAAVVGKLEESGDETIVAFAVVEHPIDAAALVDSCREKLARFKVPDLIELVPELPKTALGKVAKGDLRQRARELSSTTWRAESS